MTWETLSSPQSLFSAVAASETLFLWSQSSSAILVLHQAEREDLCVLFKSKELDVPAVARSTL